MHERRRIGLSMDYWTKRASSMNNEQPIKHSKVGRDINGEATLKHDVCSLTIECEQLPPGSYPPIRISNGWISEHIKKSYDDNHDFEIVPGLEASGDTLDWLDPPFNQAAVNPANTSLDETMNIGLIAQPIARFVAKLEPPLAIPYHIATQLYASVRVNIAQVVLSDNTSMASLILPSVKSGPFVADTKQLHQTRNIVSAASDDAGKDFQIGLYWSTPELGVILETLPFDHPRRLVEALPILRQYAFIARLLQNTFRNVAETSAPTSASKQDIRKMRMQQHTAKFSKKNMETELEALLAPRSTSVRAFDVTFVTTPVPQMTISLASKQGLKRMTFNILLNADIEIVSQNIVPEDEEEVLRQRRVEGLKTALETAEDLGIWAVWVRRKYLDDDE